MRVASTSALLVSGFVAVVGCGASHDASGSGGTGGASSKSTGAAGGTSTGGAGAGGMGMGVTGDAPIVLYTDLTSAPPRAYVTAWGRRFGATQGTSTITIGGAACAVKSWADGEIEFQLPASAKTGALVVTTAAGASPGFSLGVHPGKLYFVASNGDDSWSGELEDPKGGDGPFKSLIKGRDAIHAGDVLYIRAGTFTAEDDDGFDSNLALRDAPTGTKELPVGLVAYPSEEVVFGDHTLTHGINLFRGDTDPPQLDYWTFAKIHFKPNCDAFGDVSGIGDHDRIVGIEADHANEACESGVIEIGGGTDWKILGNYIHDSGNTKLEHAIYLGGYGLEQDFEIGWNTVRNQIGGRAVQIYGHLHGDNLDGASIHDNEFYDVDRDGILIGDTDADVFTISNVEIFDNLVVRAGRCDGQGVRIDNPTATNIRVYENTLSDDGRGAAACDQSDGHPGAAISLEGATSVEIRDNLIATFGPEATIAVVSMPSSTLTCTNDFYAGSAPPSFDMSASSGDAAFVDESNDDLHLEASSAARQKGVMTDVAKDHDGIARPDKPDCGAYQADAK